MQQTPLRRCKLARPEVDFLAVFRLPRTVYTSAASNSLPADTTLGATCADQISASRQLPPVVNQKSGGRTPRGHPAGPPGRWRRSLNGVSNIIHSPSVISQLFCRQHNLRLGVLAEERGQL